MTAVLLGILIAAAVVAILAGASRLLARRFAAPSQADEVHHAPTADGWLLGLHRYRPARPAPGREPVVLCHGLLSNRANLDLDREVSLAGHLRDAGFDVWLMELRARGASRRDPAAPRPSLWPRLGFDWSLDEFIREDLAAAVKYVRSATGAEKLHWVGHSLGGMMLCAHAAVGDLSWVRSAVTIDAPVHFAPLRQPTWPARVYARLVPVVPVLLFKPIFTLVYGLIPERALRRRMRLDRGTVLKAMNTGLVDVGSSRVLLHLAAILAEGRFRSFDRSVDYEEGPTRIRFPILVMRAPAGRTPEAAVRYVHDVCPSADKAYVRCSAAEGFSMDHDHFSIVLGREAPREIFPLIAGWLLRRSSA